MGSESRPDGIRVVTESCKEMRISDLLCGSVDDTVMLVLVPFALSPYPQCFVRSFLVLARSNCISSGFDPTQLFWITRRDELFLRFLPVLPPLNPITCPDERLWNWKPSETDIVYVTGVTLQRFVKAVQVLLDKAQRFPNFLDPTLTLASNYVNSAYHAIDSIDCPQGSPLLQGILNIASSMTHPSPTIRLPLGEAIRLFNYLVPSTLQMPSYDSLPYSLSDCESTETQVRPFLARLERNPLDTEEEWKTLQNNQLETYLKLVIPQLHASNPRLSFLTGVVTSILHYNQYVIKVQNNQREEERRVHPSLQMNVDDILQGSLSESDLHRLMDMLNWESSQEEARKQAVISYECIVVVADCFLRVIASDGAGNHLDEVYGFCTVLTYLPSLIPCLWEMRKDDILAIFRDGANPTLSAEIAKLLFAHVPPKLTGDLAAFFLPPQRLSTMLLKDTDLLKQILNHSKCSSLVLYQIAGMAAKEQCDLSVFAPVIVNQIEALHLRFQFEQSHVLEDACTLVHVLLIPGVMTPMLATVPFYESFIQLVKESTQQEGPIEFLTALLQNTLELYQSQQKEHPEHRVVLINIVGTQTAHHV